MARNLDPAPASKMSIAFLVLINTIAIRDGYAGNEKWYWMLIVTLPLLLLAIFTLRQKKHFPGK
jgi:hypothetical protein